MVGPSNLKNSTADPVDLDKGDSMSQGDAVLPVSIEDEVRVANHIMWAFLLTILLDAY